MSCISTVHLNARRLLGAMRLQKVSSVAIIAKILFVVSLYTVHDSQAYKTIEMNRERSGIDIGFVLTFLLLCHTLYAVVVFAIEFLPPC